MQIIIITINNANETKSIYIDKELYGEFRSLYCDDYYLFTHFVKEEKYINVINN